MDFALLFIDDSASNRAHYVAVYVQQAALAVLVLNCMAFVSIHPDYGGRNCRRDLTEIVAC